ncbi:DNA-binding CsgD family transcriptional regulator [Rhizobium petrolearium]|uniref:helix-turn-helix transcriptional regulator n=1 Tax=Neorhizobium petrolearium TaxID=515361 RepID=UPI001AE311EE|nr:LuxR C-terminal-related transcriptional regulator [Neorhizobium petrolearium]MBP1845804.1 DNA-binding CsgD family transcriptional regulator [Neorhizobium petrolearium]
MLALDADNVAMMAALMDEVGEPAFPEKLLEILRKLAGTDFCSAFQAEEDGSLTYLFACGYHSTIPGFAERASLDYARRYWQRDRVTRQMLSAVSTPRKVQVVRQAWNGIRDPEYRRDCYERAHVLERLTIYHSDMPRAFASLYRTRESGPFPISAVERIEAAAALLMAMLVKHVRLQGRPQTAPLHPPIQEIAGRLLQAGYALSGREAEVSAGLLLGRTHREISEKVGLALSSIVTYRQRAYRKLGVSDRRGLEALYEGISRA